jgi:hypothetical protein
MTFTAFLAQEVIQSVFHGSFGRGNTGLIPPVIRVWSAGTAPAGCKIHHFQPDRRGKTPR